MGLTPRTSLSFKGEAMNAADLDRLELKLEQIEQELMQLFEERRLSGQVRVIEGPGSRKSIIRTYTQIHALLPPREGGEPPDQKPPKDDAERFDRLLDRAIKVVTFVTKLLDLFSEP